MSMHTHTRDGVPVITHDHASSDMSHSHTETLTQQLGDTPRFASPARGEITPLDVLHDPAIETSQTVEFTVRVRSFGKADVAHRDAEKTLCEALHRAFGVDEHGHERFDVETGGQLLVFDALAADGEHSDHDVIVRRIPKAETFGGRSAVREIPAVVERQWPRTNQPDATIVSAIVVLDIAADCSLIPPGRRVLLVPQS